VTGETVTTHNVCEGETATTINTSQLVKHDLFDNSSSFGVETATNIPNEGVEGDTAEIIHNDIGAGETSHNVVGKGETATIVNTSQPEMHDPISSSDCFGGVTEFDSIILVISYFIPNSTLKFTIVILNYLY